jgi:hypothetical protein
MVGTLLEINISFNYLGKLALISNGSWESEDCKIP